MFARFGRITRITWPPSRWQISRRGVARVAAVAVVAAGGVFAFSASNAAEVPKAVPLDASLIPVLANAASSCTALTPARLAGEVMAATGFKPTPEGGIGGFTAAEWQVWAPWKSAKPSDATANLLAVAQRRCDYVGQVRLTGTPGDPWRLSLAASATSADRVAEVGGIPAKAAKYVDLVENYAIVYAADSTLATEVNPLAAGERRSATPTASPTPEQTKAAPTPSPSAKQTPVQRASNGPKVISFDGFRDAANLWLNGSATVAGGRLVLASGSNNVGSAWSTFKIDPSRSFSTKFSFEITNLSDGIAFVIQGQSRTARGASGEGLGYGARPGDTGLPRIQPSLAVEFDTYHNKIDPDGQHIAVTINGDISKHLDRNTMPWSMYGEGVVTAWIDYDAPTHTIRVYASRSDSREPMFSYHAANLQQIIGTGSAYVGFTGGTGLTTVSNPVEAVLSWNMTMNK